MVRIRLSRVGLKKQPSYRIVVIDQRRARNGKPIENIGYHNPRTRPSTDVVQEDRALYWLSVGAQPTKGVTYLFKRTGTFDRYERLKKGESMESLLAEWEAEQAEAEPVSPRTSYPSPGPGESKKKAKEQARLLAEQEAEATTAEAEEVAVAAEAVEDAADAEDAEAEEEVTE